MWYCGRLYSLIVIVCLQQLRRRMFIAHCDPQSQQSSSLEIARAPIKRDKDDYTFPCPRSCHQKNDRRCADPHKIVLVKQNAARKLALDDRDVV
jgi:hypothetical protein